MLTEMYDTILMNILTFDELPGSALNIFIAPVHIDGVGVAV